VDNVVAISIAVFALGFKAQALDGITIEVVRVFAFCDDEVVEAGSLVAEFPGVAEIPRAAGARGVGNIADIGVADGLAIRAGEDGDVADLAVAVKSNDGVLKALVMGEGPNLLAFILGLELANLNQARVHLSIRHAEAEPENLRGWLPGGGERSDGKKQQGWKNNFSHRDLPSCIEFGWEEWRGWVTAPLHRAQLLRFLCYGFKGVASWLLKSPKPVDWRMMVALVA